jgi:3-oxoacyl-[acyl-carrier protein] reductase
MSVDISLAGKVVLVTGGSRGVGAETVRLFAQSGARVIFSYKNAERAAAELVDASGGPDRCRAVQQELGSAEDGRTLVDAAIGIWGRLDALVANHGIWPSHDAPIDTMADGQWRETLGVNLDSVFGLVKAAVAHFKTRQGTAHIVFVASTAAQRGEAFHADYAASKGALISLTKSLSSELAGEGILVNCVAPGWIATDMSAPALATEAGRKKIFATIPLGRVATTAEIAGPILFLCSPWAGFISGEIVNVNGGAVLVG